MVFAQFTGYIYIYIYMYIYIYSETSSVDREEYITQKNDGKKNYIYRYIWKSKKPLQ